MGTSAPPGGWTPGTEAARGGHGVTSNARRFNANEGARFLRTGRKPQTVFDQHSRSLRAPPSSPGAPWRGRRVKDWPAVARVWARTAALPPWQLDVQTDNRPAPDSVGIVAALRLGPTSLVFHQYSCRLRPLVHRPLGHRGKKPGPNIQRRSPQRVPFRHRALIRCQMTWSGASRQTCSVSPASICSVAWEILKRCSSSWQISCSRRSSSPAPGRTRCAVRAVSVVLIAQI